MNQHQQNPFTAAKRSAEMRFFSNDGTPFYSQDQATAYDIYMDREAAKAKYFYFFPEDAKILHLYKTTTLKENMATQTSEVSISKQTSLTTNNSRSRRKAKRQQLQPIIRQPRPPPLLTTPPPELAFIPRTPTEEVKNTEQVIPPDPDQIIALQDFFKEKNLENDVYMDLASEIDDFATEYVENDHNLELLENGKIEHHLVHELLQKNNIASHYCLNVIEHLEFTNGTPRDRTRGEYESLLKEHDTQKQR